MPYSFKVRRTVEFHETDMAGIVHYSNFFRFIESAEHAFFRSLGHTIAPAGPDSIGWPRVHCDCDFRRPLRFEDQVEVELIVREKRARSLSYVILFRKLNGAAAEEVARGHLSVACIRRHPETGEMKAVPIPEEIASLIEVAPPEVLENLGE